MRRSLMRVSADGSLSLPLEAVTQTFVIFGKRESGKTNAATVLAEEMLTAGAQLVVCDPVGAWYGIRASADGRGPGFPIPILGGEHGDVPLNPSSGVLVADLVVDERVSLVLDVSEMDPPEMLWCMTDFCERLFRRNRSPLHLIFEEADEFAPERQRHMARLRGIPEGYSQDRLLWAVSRIVRKGRAPRGLGCTLVTQRSSVVSKDVISQPDTLIAFRTTSPIDTDAIDAWIRRHGYPDKRAEFLRTISTLPAGTGWVWSPEWLKVFRQVPFRRRATFDSGATPKMGRHLRKPKTLAEIDLGALERRMLEAVQRKRETDPALLRQRLAEADEEIRRLTEDLASRPIATSAATRTPKAVGTLDKRSVGRLERAVGKLATVSADGRKHAHELVLAAQRIGAAYTDGAARLEAVSHTLSRELRAAVGLREPLPPPAMPLRAPSSGPVVSAAAPDRPQKLGAPERKLLSALAQYPEGLTIRQLALLTGYKRTGGGFTNPLGRVRSAGFAEGRDPVRITKAGRAVLGQVDTLPPPGRPLLQYWMQRLGSPEREILRVLAEAHPAPLSPAEVASRMVSSRGAPYSPTGGGFTNPLGRVRTLGLVEGRSELTLTATLMGSTGHHRTA